MQWATDFFTAEVWTCHGLTTYYVLFFLHVQIRASITSLMATIWR